jgi:F-type H+-transporting ATPase subunit b
MLTNVKKRLLACAVLALLGCPAMSMAQTAQNPSASSPSQSETPLSERQASNGGAQYQLAHSSREAAREEPDEKEALRHSASVKFISRITGFDLEKAYWISVFINFLIVLVVLWTMLKKILPAAFKDRSGSIQKRIEEARKASEEARRRLAEVEGRLSRLDTEISQMRDEAEASAKHEEERMMVAAEEERRRIVQTAEQEIAASANAARRELKAFAADLAVDLAGKKIKIGQSEDQMLVREFTSRIGKDGQ